MSTWDEQISQYEADVKRLESQVEALVASASNAVLISSGIAAVVGILVGLLIAAL